MHTGWCASARLASCPSHLADRRTDDRSEHMRIGILGTGAMATALGAAWVRAGHDVRVGGRDAQAASRTARRTGASGAGSLAEAAAHGEVVLTAVPAQAAPRLAGELSPLLAGRTLIDCTVPMEPGADGPVLTTDGATSVARIVADAAPGAQVVKAFGVCHESIWTLDRPSFEGAPLAVPFCTDQPDAAARVAELITSMGCTPLPCGGLGRAALLEAAAVFAIGVWWSGAEVRSAFPAPALAPGAVDD
ncbi:NAD(P)-binding domain-containing protein [Streptomyces sp. NPDC031705]|uniref:NADPH-dependent F420 reductase n=1 Tax=Streptomyces sp. NPDC031705 TaxID=3155729 RepID=UPI0033FE328B